MNKLVDRLLGDDFLWNAIVSSLQGKRKRARTGFINVNCPMCLRRGFTQDTRGRCGIKHGGTKIGVNCYNCGFKLRWHPGETLGRSWQDFLCALGMHEIDVKRLNHKALSYRSILEKSPEAMALIPESINPTFEVMRLPEGARRMDEWANDPNPSADFVDAISYLYSRGEEVAESQPFYWTPVPGRHRFNRRIIIPFQHEGQIVGYTARAIDQGVSRYHMEAPANFLFNARAMTLAQRKFVILTEGVLDALAIDAVSTLGAHLNAQQIAWIKSVGKTVIMVPDRDKRGSAMIDLALEQGWHVAFPKTHRAGEGIRQWWGPQVKDCADAVKQYGKVWTVLSIIESATKNKLEINIKRKLFA